REFRVADCDVGSGALQYMSFLLGKQLPNLGSHGTPGLSVEVSRQSLDGSLILLQPGERLPQDQPGRRTLAAPSIYHPLRILASFLELPQLQIGVRQYVSRYQRLPLAGDHDLFCCNSARIIAAFVVNLSQKILCLQVTRIKFDRGRQVEQCVVLVLLLEGQISQKEVD